MNKREEIHNKIAQCIKNITMGKINKINNFDKIEEDLGIDSMGITEMLFTLEDLFKIEISDDDLSGIKIVDDIIDLIITKYDMAEKMNPVM
jgi:acyl carrier protein